MRLRWILLLLPLALSGSAQARNKAAEPNSLTPKEAAEGWIRLFDGETNFGWTPRGDAQWTVAEGMVQCAAGGAGMLATNTEFADYELKAECWIDKEANSGIFLRGPVGDAEISPMSSYEVNIYDAHPKWPTGSINEVKKTGRKVTTVGKWSAFDILADGDHFVVSVDGKKTLDTRDTKFTRGVIALQYYGKGGTVKFRNIKLRPLHLKSLFNGKDLTGWKVLPGHASVYTVTPEGWMNVKNGNGEIQSEAQFGDFALQLDIFSNGDHLNSGVFFREEPGQFWIGYESQIRNQWEGDNRAKPVDYGTGGVYNLQPSRKVVSSDREWFTMTVVASGTHIATWVNGYQTADFTDTRPANESNARSGARTRAGGLGLQGHDPTTDLSFRNIRAGEYPAPRK